MTFGPLTVRFDERVLRPRSWTLAQSNWAATLADTAPEGVILELCAGAGQIGLALAAQVGARRVVLIDADAAACEYARDNAIAAGVADRVEVRQKPIDSAIGPTERFALILADPPWMPTAEIGQFPDDPQTAIDGGPDGLTLARSCLELIGRHLSPGGLSILQVRDEDQAAQVRRYVESRNSDLGLRVDEVRAVLAANGTLVKVSRQ